VPAASGDARERLHAHLTEQGHSHLADAVENALIAVAGAELRVTAPKSYTLYFSDPGFAAAVAQVFGRALNVKISVGEVEERSSLPAASAAPAGEVRRVRNLQE
jgi:hypothetical protein